MLRNRAAWIAAFLLCGVQVGAAADGLLLCFSNDRNPKNADFVSTAPQFVEAVTADVKAARLSNIKKVWSVSHLVSDYQPGLQLGVYRDGLAFYDRDIAEVAPGIWLGNLGQKLGLVSVVKSCAFARERPVCEGNKPC